MMKSYLFLPLAVEALAHQQVLLGSLFSGVLAAVHLLGLGVV